MNVYNHVFSLAEGAYFKWSAQDDLCEPTFVERCLEILDGRSDVVWCSSRFSHIDPPDQILGGRARRDLSWIVGILGRPIPPEAEALWATQPIPVM